MSNTGSHVLQTKNLAIGFLSGKNARTILDNINIALKPGELVCFMGPNGVGKSTLLRTISGVQPPLKGEVLINNIQIEKLSLIEKAKLISIVLTERTTNANFSVKELITLGRYPYTDWNGKLNKEDLLKIEEAIALTKTEDLVYQKLHTLSDGQLQKAMIARAFAQDSDIMILDEPTAHLDLNNRLEIMHLLVKMAHSTNKSILVATHELDLAVQTSDRLWLAAFNSPILSGTPEDLILNGAVENTFSNQNIKFNLLSGRFELVKSFTRKIRLSGENPVKTWTRFALERVGYKIEDESDAAVSPIVIIKKENERQVWVLKDKDNESVFGSIEALLETLILNHQ